MSKIFFIFIGFNVLLVGLVQVWFHSKDMNFYLKKRISISSNLDHAEKSTLLPAKPGSMFSIELGVFDKRESAEKELKRLSKMGIQAFYTPYRTEAGQILFKIRRGVYSSKENAEEIIKNLAQQQIKGRVVEL